MTEIVSRYDEERGEWLAFTVDPPYMCVAGLTEDITRSVVERAIVWYQTREVERAKDEVLQLIRGDVESVPIEEPAPVEDTAPSEILTTYEQSAYMLGDQGDQGC